MGRAGVVAAVCAAMMVVATGLLVFPEEGCSSCSGCIGGRPATFNLSCIPGDLTSVVASGPCSMDAGSDSYPGVGSSAVGVSSPSPGVCHIVLTFATGFTYSADVTFTLQTEGSCPGCQPYIGATSGPFTVNNPSDTCIAVGAGVDAGE
jgi:hypothetical protein